MSFGRWRLLGSAPDAAACSFSLKKGPGFSPKKGPVRVSSSRARIWVFAMEGGEDEASPLPLAACQALGSLPSGALSS